MTPDEMASRVRSEIGDSWDTTNLHGVDLRKALVRPRRINVIERFVEDGKTRDEIAEAWLVLVENATAGGGYRIVARLDGSQFGLASEGWPSDQHLVMCGWYGDFMTTFQGM